MNRLKELRKTRQLTITELSLELNIPQSSLTNYENEKVKPRNSQVWQQIANFFQVSTDYLLGKTAAETKSNTDLFTMIETGTLWEARLIDEDLRELDFIGFGKFDGQQLRLRFDENAPLWRHCHDVFKNQHSWPAGQPRATFVQFPNFKTDPYLVVEG